MKQTQWSFSLYLGSGDEGETLYKMIESGMKRHGQKALREYVIHCVREQEKREAKKAAA